MRRVFVWVFLWGYLACACSSVGHQEVERQLAQLDEYVSLFELNEEDDRELARLLSELENNSDLSKIEKIRFLILKARAFSGRYREYSSALLFAKEAEQLAEGEGLCEETYKALFTQFEVFLQLKDTIRHIQVLERMEKLLHEQKIDSSHNELINKCLCFIYQQTGNYTKALHYIPKGGNDGFYHNQLAYIYAGLDSTKQAIALLDTLQVRRTFPGARGGLAYQKAQVWKEAGDTYNYEKELIESILLYDQVPSPYPAEINQFAPSKEYAALLWEKGRRAEAIRQLEKILPRLTDPFNYNNSFACMLVFGQKKLALLRQITDYYFQMGRQQEGWQLRNTYDSLRTLYEETNARYVEATTTTQLRFKGLVYSLELQNKQVQQQKIILHFTSLLVAILVLIILMLCFFYYRRKKRLDALYARQKGIEFLQKAVDASYSPSEDAPSKDELLFRNIENRIRGDQLFLNPNFLLEDLWRLVGSNRSYVSSCINQYTGTNFNQWINKIRIDFTIELIHSGENNLRTLAKKSGFSSESSFFRNFKQCTLLTPGQYIEREKADSNQ